MSWQETTLPPQEANPNESGKKQEHNRHSAPSEHHTKLQPSAMLNNTSNFQGLSKYNQSQILKQRRASAPSQGRSITPSCFVTRAASSRRVLENSTVQRLNAISLLGCAILFILQTDQPVHLLLLSLVLVWKHWENESQQWHLSLTSNVIQYNTRLLKQVGPNYKHLPRNSPFPPDIAARAP